MVHAAGRILGRGGLEGGALLLIQQGDHALRQAVGLGDVLCGQAGVQTGDQQTDVLLLQGGKATGDVAAAHIADHEHGMHVAGHRQIQDLQLPVFGVLVLVVLVRQGHALLLQETAGADLDVVVVAPGGKAQPAVDLQILDREQDVGAVLNDLTEQPLQSTAALVEHAGRVQDGAVDAAALEDADILQHHAVGGKQVLGIHLKGVDAAQFLNGRPAGHHGPHGTGGTLQAQRGHAGDEGGGQGCTHAQHRRQGGSGQLHVTAYHQTQQGAEQGHAQQDVPVLLCTAFPGALVQALCHKAFVRRPGAAQQHPGVLLFQIPCQCPDQVLVPGAIRTLQVGGFAQQFIAAAHGRQHHPAAQQRQEQPQGCNAGEDGQALGGAVGVGREQGRDGLQ